MGPSVAPDCRCDEELRYQNQAAKTIAVNITNSRNVRRKDDTASCDYFEEEAAANPMICATWMTRKVLSKKRSTKHGPGNGKGRESPRPF
jgi:hypothetical protein